jgi:hypothetical protein
MRTYDAALTGLSGKDVLELIETLPSKIRATFTPVEEAAVLMEKPKRKMINALTILTMTGKKAQPGSNRELVLQALERLEVAQGVGTVTRKQLKKRCEEKGLDSQIFYQLVKDGYIKGLE